MYRRILLLFLISLCVGDINAQQALNAPNITTGASNTDAGKFYYATNQKHEAARAIEFNERTVTASNFLANINRHFNIPEEFSFVETESNTDNIGMRHHFLRQYYKGIPLEGLGYRVHEKNGFVTSANGKAIRDLDIDISTTLREEQAFGLAVEFLQTKDSIFRSGKKLIVSKNFTFTSESFSVAFQFDIDVSLIERWRISIDARNGELINKVSLVKSCFETQESGYDTGTGLTNYYGSKTIRVKKFDDGSSRLEGQTEHGGIIETKDFRNASIMELIIANSRHVPSNITSSDNNYTNSNQRPGVSVQWAVEQAYEYYYTKHSRNSFDNNGATITSYVHVDKDLNNAFWSRKKLIFGDGSDNNPLVELDVVSHELTHGVTEYEADLRYSYESGALNESFSDIFAKAVEFTTFGDAATWQLARHYQDGGLRDMSNPNLKDQPDTYQGDMWYIGYEDYGGVHTNSGVQNFWFYLLCEGGSGVNDGDVSYSVKSIGMDTAVNIAYRNLTEYLISYSDYLDCRIGSLLATADLYGINSSAYQEVDKAWDAVGVIDEPIITSLNVYDITATTVKLNGSLLPRGDTVTYHFEYGTTPAFGSSTSIYTYTDAVEGMITGLQSETKYYVRLVATNENGNSYDTSEFTTNSLAPLVTIINTVDVSDTSAILYGQVNPNSLYTSYYFEYGPTPEMVLATPSYPLPDTTEFLNVSAQVINLQARQTYYYKLIATNNFASTASDSLSIFTALKPVISSFTPVSANKGTEVTITGQGFNLIPEKNWINFGATKGKVLSSSATEIKVEVPGGASFGQISLLDTESGLLTESVQEFVPTFSGEFGKEDLQLRAGFNDLRVSRMAVHDMDGDGRPEVVASHAEGVTIFQNVNAGGDITNESFVRSNVPINNFYFLSLTDFDGNGLMDLVGNYGDGLRIYPNLSVPGYVFFGVPVDLSIGNWGNIQFKDFDNDGHIDIAGVRYLPGDSTMFTIFRNENPKGTLTINNLRQRYTNILPYDYILSLNPKDLNNDDKLDLIVSIRRTDQFLVLINKSQPGNFEFEELIVEDPVVEKYAKYLALDLNQDGWKDITSYSQYENEKMTIFENNGPNITLSKPIIILPDHIERSVKPGDINGDGKVDLLVGDHDGRFIFLKNEIEKGEQLSDSSFVLFEHYGINDNNKEVTSDIILNDLNGDGRPEIINNLGYTYFPYTGHQLEIWQNAPSDCIDPGLVSVEASGTTATIILPDDLSFEQFEMEYAIAGSNQWWEVGSTTLNRLSVSTSYQLRVRAECYLSFTPYHYIDFTTDCVDLRYFYVSQIWADNVSINVANLNSMEVQYCEVGKDEWITLPENTNQITNLLPGTTYDLRYRGRCTQPVDFTYTQFTTLCPKLVSLSINNIEFNKAEVHWFALYPGDVLIEYSVDNINWTTIEETQTMFPLIPGIEYQVRGNLVCPNKSSGYTYTSFITPCPTVSMLSAGSITPFSANISWDEVPEADSYTVRYSLSNKEHTFLTNSTSILLVDLIPGSAYTVSVAPECLRTQKFNSTTFNTLCYEPNNLSVDSITYTTAKLLWDEDYTGMPYSIDYAIAGSDDWQTRISFSTDILLTNLLPGTEYQVRVHINCLSVTVANTFFRFETDLYGETTLAPNPTENTITLYPSKNLIGNPYGIYDSTGRRVAGGNLLDYTFDLSTFATGIYILKIEEEMSMKIIKR